MSTYQAIILLEEELVDVLASPKVAAYNQEFIDKLKAAIAALEAIKPYF